MRKYVLCIAETNSGNIVVLRKTKPTWQAGLINFPGGKIEDTDINSMFAARREFREETGIDYDSWEYKGIFKRELDFFVELFYAKSDIFKNAKTTTDEEVFLVTREFIFANPEKFMENFVWELQIASDPAIEQFSVTYKQIGKQ